MPETAIAEYPVTWAEVYDYMFKYVHEMLYERQVQREGQAYFNALHSIYCDVADVVRATDADPFYDDTRLKAFFDAIMPYFI